MYKVLKDAHILLEKIAKSGALIITKKEDNSRFILTSKNVLESYARIAKNYSSELYDLEFVPQAKDESLFQLKCWLVNKYQEQGGGVLNKLPKLFVREYIEPDFRDSSSYLIYLWVGTRKNDKKCIGVFTSASRANAIRFVVRGMVAKSGELEFDFLLDEKELDLLKEYKQYRLYSEGSYEETI